jgi:hypothetical protein
MSLPTEILEAHGGLERWTGVRGLAARMRFGGPFWAGRGQAGVLDRVTVTIDTTRERLTITPYTGAGRVLSFDASPTERLTLTAADGAELDRRDDPRPGFPAYRPENPWDALQTAYFASVATWN